MGMEKSQGSNVKKPDLQNIHGGFDRMVFFLKLYISHEIKRGSETNTHIQKLFALNLVFSPRWDFCTSTNRPSVFPKCALMCFLCSGCSASRLALPLPSWPVLVTQSSRRLQEPDGHPSVHLLWIWTLLLSEQSWFTVSLAQWAIDIRPPSMPLGDLWTSVLFILGTQYVLKDCLAVIKILISLMNWENLHTGVMSYSSLWC